MRRWLRFSLIFVSVLLVTVFAVTVPWACGHTASEYEPAFDGCFYVVEVP